jgi:hypothetical protein
MEITPLTIYLWQLVDGLKDALILPFAIGLIAGLASFIIATIATNTKNYNGDPEMGPEMSRRVFRMSYCALSIAVVCGLMNVLIPTSKTVAMMVIIPGIANSSVIQEDVPELWDVAVKALKEKLTSEKE